MKLRIKGNTVRLRLSQGEVDQLKEEKMVAESTFFPTGGTLEYRIASGDFFSAELQNQVVLVKLPEKEIEDWAVSDRVSLGGDLNLENGGILSILVEKDFKCLTVRPEDESDLFPNPKQHH